MAVSCFLVIPTQTGFGEKQRHHILWWLNLIKMEIRAGRKDRDEQRRYRTTACGGFIALGSVKPLAEKAVQQEKFEDGSLVAEKQPYR